MHLYSVAHFDRLSRITGCLITQKLDALQVVSPDGNGTSSGGFAVIIMTGVVDRKPDVVLLRKSNRLLVIGGLARVHGILNIGSHHAAGALGVERIVALICEVRSHDGG